MRAEDSHRHALVRCPPTSGVEAPRTPTFDPETALPRHPSPRSMSPAAPFRAEESQKRSHTSFSEAPTLVRNSSINSTSSQRQKPGDHDVSARPRPTVAEAPVIRSIFPQYDPELPLAEQRYYPTQASPTNIPRAVISKRPYSPALSEQRSLPSPRSPRAYVGSPMSAPPTVGSFPAGILDVVKRVADSTEELRELWKAANGWRVSASEGRSFCLEMTRYVILRLYRRKPKLTLESSVESNIHTLSSSTQPLYTLRVDPTSTSALLTLTRQDPNKAARDSTSAIFTGSPKIGSPKIGSSRATTVVEVLTTTLEETTRRLPPNDGLVALLYPRAAANMAIDLSAKTNRPIDEAIQQTAERECARLVWDDDSGHYYLVHPVMATPFIVQIATSPAWSRVEYTLEHPELPLNIAKLTRDGRGGGFMDIDTGVAGRIDSFYIIDVAISALLVVAISEEKGQKCEVFAAPPKSSAPMTPKGKKDFKIEEMEIDLESQMGDGIGKTKEKSDLPRSTRGVLKVLSLTFRLAIWLLSITFKAVSAIIIAASSCLTRN